MAYRAPIQVSPPPAVTLRTARDPLHSLIGYSFQPDPVQRRTTGFPELETAQGKPGIGWRQDVPWSPPIQTLSGASAATVSRLELGQKNGRLTVRSSPAALAVVVRTGRGPPRIRRTLVDEPLLSHLSHDPVLFAVVTACRPCMVVKARVPARWIRG